MTIFRLVTRGTIEERVINIYQKPKLVTAEKVYQASFLHGKGTFEAQAPEQDMISLLEEESMAIVPYAGTGKEITTDIEYCIAMTEEVSRVLKVLK